jgi:hypothetical protein
MSQQIYEVDAARRQWWGSDNDQKPLSLDSSPARPSFDQLPHPTYSSEGLVSWDFGRNVSQLPIHKSQRNPASIMFGGVDSGDVHYSVPTMSNHSLQHGPGYHSQPHPKTDFELGSTQSLNEEFQDTTGMDNAFPPSYYELSPSQPLTSQALSRSRDRETAQTCLSFTIDHDETADSNFFQDTFFSTPPSSHGAFVEPSSVASTLSEEDEITMENSDATLEGETKEEPYAKRIYRCLINAPDHTMVLRGIYDWFVENTEKGKEREASAWKNSIRHNLSMNKVGSISVRCLFLLLTSRRLLKRFRRGIQMTIKKAVYGGLQILQSRTASSQRPDIVKRPLTRGTSRRRILTRNASRLVLKVGKLPGTLPDIARKPEMHSHASLHWTAHRQSLANVKLRERIASALLRSFASRQH